MGVKACEKTQTLNKTSMCFEVRREQGRVWRELLPLSTEAGNSPGEMIFTLEEEVQVGPKSMEKSFQEGDLPK